MLCILGFLLKKKKKYAFKRDVVCLSLSTYQPFLLPSAVAVSFKTVN